jgi:hypothetical protein
VLEQMLRRPQINARLSGPGTRLPRGIGGSLRRALERLAWPFERLAWTFERRLLWPLRERVAGRGPSAQIAGAGALVAVAAAAVAVGLLLSEGNGRESVERPARPAPLANVAPAAAATEGAPGPSLHGIPPNFGANEGAVGGARPVAGSGEAGNGGASEAGGEGANAGDAKAASEGAADEGPAATASSAKPVPAGPVAMEVARRFSNAFVYYEIGKRPARTRAVFEATATPQLAEALEQRPPRLPKRARVPKAEVVNLVPGPRRGQDYTVSVSLLRVGLTSELRITMRHDKTDGWQVAEILG